MSLCGLALAVGLLVDGSIGGVENIVERLGRAHEEGTPRLNLVYLAASEVIVPVSAGIAIIALVFLPLLSPQGLEGKLFAPVALTIVFALRSEGRRVGTECVRPSRPRWSPLQ